MDTPIVHPIHRLSRRPHLSIRAATIAAFVLTAAIGLDMPDVALGATITVTTTLDELSADGHCSLREAISAANSDSTGPGGDCATGNGTDTISLPSGHFTLSIPGAGENANASGDLDILSNLTIAGAGAGTTTIDANHIDRVLEVMPGRIVTISGVTITGGRAPKGTDGSDKTGSTGQSAVAGDGGPGDPGGGVFNNSGALTIVDSTISDNAAGPGGNGGVGQGGEGVTAAYGTYGGYGVAGKGGNGGSGGAGGSGISSVGAYGGSGHGGAGGDGGSGGGIGESGGGSLSVVGSTIAGNTAGAGGDGGAVSAADHVDLERDLIHLRYDPARFARAGFR